MERLELSLAVNNHILCSIREVRLTTPLDIRRLWKHFSEVVENSLENGRYGNERLEDAINNINFKGWCHDPDTSFLRMPNENIQG